MVLNSISNRTKIEKLKKTILPVLKQNDAMRAGIFGSAARGELKRGSDIDILIKFKGRKSLFDIVRIERELGEGIGRKVDLLEYYIIHPRLKDRISKGEVRIL